MDSEDMDRTVSSNFIASTNAPHDFHCRNGTIC